MADRQCLTESAEDDLLMRNEAGQTHAVNPHAVDLSAACARKLLLLIGMPLPHGRTRLLDQFRRLQGRARRRIKLVVMVQLDDLDVRHILRRLTAHEHHEDCADGEVRCKKDRRLLLQRQRFELRLFVRRHARRADDGRDPMLHGEHRVGKHDIRPREIHHDVRLCL